MMLCHLVSVLNGSAGLFFILEAQCDRDVNFAGTVHLFYSTIIEKSVWKGPQLDIYFNLLLKARAFLSKTFQMSVTSNLVLKTF